MLPSSDSDVLLPASTKIYNTLNHTSSSPAGIEDTNSDLSTAVIVGTVIATFIAAVLIVTLLFFLFRKLESRTRFQRDHGKVDVLDDDASSA